MNNKKIENYAKTLALLAAKPSIKALIAYLMNEGDYTKTQKDIVKEINAYQNLLQVDLQKLIALKILEESPSGNKKYYKINKDRAYVLLVLIDALETAQKQLMLK